MDQQFKQWVENFASDWTDRPEDFAFEFERVAKEEGWDLAVVLQFKGS